MKAFYGTVNQKLLVAEEYKAVDSFFTQIYIFSNGVWASYLDDAGQPFNGTNRSHLSINIPQYNQSWAGEYTVVFYSYCHDVVYTLLQGCCKTVGFSSRVGFARYRSRDAHRFTHCSRALSECLFQFTLFFKDVVIINTLYVITCYMLGSQYCK